jgi:hypothetical protein
MGQEEGEKPNPKSEIRQTWDLFVSTRFSKFLPLIVWSGISLALY